MVTDNVMMTYEAFCRKWGGNMYRLIFIAKNNLKKKKSDVAVLFFLTMLAALLLYVSISVLTHTRDVIQTAYEKYNSADFLMASGCEEVEKITAVFEEQPEVVELEKSEGIYLLSLSYYKGNESADDKEMTFLIQPMDESRKMSRIPEVENLQKDSILLPYHMKAGSGYEVGDTIHLEIGETKQDYTVCGFVEDIMFSTPLNIDIFQCYVMEEEYQKLLEEGTADAGQMTIYRMQLKEGTDTADFEERIASILNKEIPELAQYKNLLLNSDAMIGGDGMLSNISMSIILVFSFLLIMIALIIVRFSMKNFIKGNLKNIGILMASGYTSRQLIKVSLLEMTGIAFFGTLAALLAGSFLSKPIGELEASFIGLSWNQPFDVRTAFLVLAIVCMVTMFVTYSSSRVYGKISVLDALRGGITTHNFRKSHLPLENCPLPESLALGCKSVLSEKAKHITILGIVTILSLASCIGFALYQNFGSNTDGLYELIGLELGDAIIQDEEVDEIKEEIQDWEMVSKVNSYGNDKITLYVDDEKTTITCDFWDNPENVDNIFMVEGRLPKYDNEIVVSVTISKELGIEVGDVIYVEGKQEKLDYIVCGFDQKMSEMGRRTQMTMEGGKRLNGECATMQIYAYLEDGYSFEAFEEKLSALYPNANIMNSKESSENITATLGTGMFLICLVFVAMTVLIVSLVVTLLVKTKMISEWKQYGVYKALGFTTKQLIVQTMMSNLPVITIGAVLGSILSIYLLNPLVTTCLSFCGIFKSDLSIQPVWLILSIVIIIIVATIVSFLCAFKVRKLKPIEMLSVE